MTRFLIVAASVALCALAPRAGAQTSSYLEAGGARVRYGDTAQVNAGTVSGAVAVVTPSASFSALAAGSTTAQSSWTIFGGANGSVFTPARLLRGELHGSGSGTTYGTSAGSAQVLGGARLHLSRSVGGVWIGAGAGSAKDAIGWRPTRVTDVGGWVQRGPAAAQAVVTRVRLGDAISYTDAEGTLRLANHRGEIAAVAGVRSAIRGYDEFPSPWASVNGTAWLMRTVGITAGVGSYPSDPGQNLPSANYVTVGVRLAPRRSVPFAAPQPSDVLTPSARTTTPAMTVTAGPGGSRVITYRNAVARRVEVMGDFNDWVPVEMTRASSGVWAMSVPLSAGVHQVNVRVDGGEWTVPDGLTPLKDEFGGSVGILVVP